MHAFALLSRLLRSEEVPNHSIERTSTGGPHLALISFWAKCVPPVPAAHVKRSASYECSPSQCRTC